MVLQRYDNSSDIYMTLYYIMKLLVGGGEGVPRELERTE